MPWSTCESPQKPEKRATFHIFRHSASVATFAFVFVRVEGLRLAQSSPVTYPKQRPVSDDVALQFKMARKLYRSGELEPTTRPAVIISAPEAGV